MATELQAPEVHATKISQYLNDESTPDIIKDMISHNNTQLHHLYWKHPSWYLDRCDIEPMLLHREGGPMLLALAQAQYEGMKFYFPREVRDLVWAQVWDEDTIEDSLVYMRNTINATCQMCIKPEDLNCPYHLCLPFFVRPELVGREMATELVESWYYVAATKHDRLLHAYNPKGVKEIICRDAFNTGREPAQFIRKLEIDMTVDEFVPPQLPWEQGVERWGKIGSADHRRELITEPLFKIQNKRNFKLVIKVSQKHIRLNLWKEVFDALREPVKVMKDEGAIVKATFVYKEGYSIHDGVVTYDILDAMTQPEEEWKANAVTFFDAQPDVSDIHRLYRDENRPDFDPDSEVYLTQEEIYDRQESIMDSIMYADNYDGPPPHNFLREYMETGTLRHEEGVCQCPDCIRRVGDQRATTHYSSDEDGENGGYAYYDDDDDDDDDDDGEDDEASDQSDENGSYEGAGSDDEEMDDIQGGQQSGASHQT